MSIFWDSYRAFTQSKQWDLCLEGILSDEAIYEPVRRLNDQKKSLGVSGLGTILFGEMFGLNVDPIAANVTSAFNFFTAYVDCYLDGSKGFEYNGDDLEFVSFLLEDSFDYLTTGETDNELLVPLNPVVSFFREHILTGEQSEVALFFEDVKQYAMLVEDDLRTDDVQKRLDLRIDLGIFYGKLSSGIIDIFSAEKLSGTQREATEIFFACGTILDDYIDVFEDGDRSYLLQGSEGTYDRFLRLQSHRKLVKKMYQEGEHLLEGSPSQARYRSIFHQTMFAVDLLFLKRGADHYVSNLFSR